MQKNPQELSWQAIEAIVGVKLPTNVLRFDDIGFHLIEKRQSVVELDSDIEIVEDEWESERNDKTDSSNNDSRSPEGDRPPSIISNYFDGTDINSTIDIMSCSVCDIKFETKDKFSEHMSKEHNDENDNSVENGLSIENYLEINLSTESEASHSCNQCNQLFSSESALSQHRCIAKVLQERRYPCHTCAEKFNTYWELRKHINTHFPGMLDTKSSYCHLCQKDYTKTGFMNHLRKHTGERPFVCELCHKAFSQSSSLSIHMKFHLNVRKHACTLCEKKFVTKSELSRHMTVHTKQKSYYCGVCDKAFTRSDNMKKHEKTHG